ncbi:hypothetical protein Pmani_002882 [Petrolisthes manimaculis]|uniref:Uncharacterized protein n=1 Tax=Petrolisthes manimaculis TaxID=1843537 RepID=A0AAE1UQ09_9EUCA|nr:hypothetical protein Pmani_002882 [Petrolisthes manimaculis]
MLGWKYKLQLGRVQKRRGLGVDSVSGLLRGARRCHQPNPQERYRSRTRQQDLLEKHSELQQSLHPDRPHLYQQRPQGNTQPRRVGGRVLPPVPPSLQLPGGKIKSNSLRVCWRDELYATPWPPRPHPASPCHITENWIRAHRSHLWRRRRSSYSLPPLSLASRWPCTTPISMMPREYGGEDPSGAPGGEVFVLGGKSVSMGHHPGQRALSWPGEETRARKDGACMCIGGDRLRLGNGRFEKTWPHSDHPMRHRYQDHPRQTLARTSAPQRTPRKDEAVEDARMNANSPSKLSWKYMEMGRVGTEGGWVETDNPGVGAEGVGKAKTGAKDNTTKTSQPSKTKPQKPPRGRSPSRKVTMEVSGQQQRHTATNQQIPTYKHSDTKRCKHSESKCSNGVKNIQGDSAKNVITKNQQGDTAGNHITNTNQRNSNVTKSTSMRFYTQANSWWEKLTETSVASNHRKSKHKADATGNSIRDVGGGGGKKGGGLGYIKGPGAGGLKNCTGGKSCDALVTCTCLKGPGVTDCSSCIKGTDVKAVEPSLKSCSSMKVSDKTSDKKICSVLKNCPNVKESFTNVRESCSDVRNVCGDGMEGNASGITTSEKSSVSVDFIADDSLDQSSDGRESLDTSEEVVVVTLFGGEHDTDEGFDDCDSDLTKLSRKSSTEALDQNGEGGSGGGGGDGDSGGDLSWQSRVTLATLPPPPLPDGDQQHIHNWLPPDSLVVSPPISYSGPTGFTTPERTLSSATYLCQSETIVTVTPTTIFVPHTFVSATPHTPQLSSDGTCLAGHGMQADEKSSSGGSLDHPSMLHDSLEPELEHENKSGKLNNMLDDSAGMGRPGSVLQGEVAVQESTSRPQSRSGCKPISQKVRLMLETVEAGMVTSVRPPSATAFIETRRTTTQSGSRSPICSPRSCASPGSSPKFKSPISSPINNGKRSDVGSPFQVYDFLPRYETGSSSPYRKSGVDKTWDTLDEKEDEMESSVDEPYLPTSDIKSLVLNSGVLAREETSVDDDDDNEGNWNQQYKTGRMSTPDPKPFMTIKMKHNDLDRDGVVAAVREKPKSGKKNQPVYTPEYLTTTGVVRTKPQLFPPSSSPLPQVPVVKDALVTDTQPCEEIYTRDGERGDINSCTLHSDYVYSEEGKVNTYTTPIDLSSDKSIEQTGGCLYRERVTINHCVPGDILCGEGKDKTNNSVSLSDSVTCEAVICSEGGVSSDTHNATAATHTHLNTDAGDILSSSSTSDQHTPLYSSGHRNSFSCNSDRNSSVSNSDRDISTNSGVVSTFLPPGAATFSSSTTITSTRVTDRNQHYPRQSPTTSAISTTTNTTSRQSPLARFTNQYHKVWEEYTKQIPSKKKTFTSRITEKEIDKIREENVSENVTCLLPEKLDTNNEVVVSGFSSLCDVSGEVDVVSKNPNPVLPEEVCTTRENSVPNERKKVRDSERTQRFRREKVSQSVSLAEDSEDSGEGDGTRRPSSLTSYLSTFNMDVSQPSPLLKHSSGSQPTQVLKTLSLTGIIKQRRGRKLPKLPTELDNVSGQAAGAGVTGVDSVDAGGVTKILSNVPLNSDDICGGSTGVVAGTDGVGGDSGAKIQTRERRLPVLPGGGKHHTHRHLREIGDPQGRLSPQTVVRIRDVIKFWNTKASSQNQTHQTTTRLSLHSDQHPSTLSILHNNNCDDEDNNKNNNNSERHNRRLLLQQEGSTDSEGHASRTSRHMRTKESDRQTITPHHHHHHHDTLTRSTHTTLESRSTRRQDGRSWHADSENGESVPVERKVTPLTAHSEINGTQGKKATEENTVKLPGAKSGSSDTQLLQKMEIGDCVMEGRRFVEAEDSVIENARSVVEEGENSEVVSGCCIGGDVGTSMSGGREGDTKVEGGVGNETLNVEEVEVVILEKDKFNLSLPPDYPPPPPPPDSPLGEVSPTTDTSHTPTAHSSISSPHTSSPILPHTQVPSSSHAPTPSLSQPTNLSPIRTPQSAYGSLRLPEYTTQPTSTYTRLHTHIGVPDVPSVIVSPLSSLATLKPTTTTTTAVTSLSTAYVSSLPMYFNHREVMNTKEVCCV